nr:immunoglobulin heavy chain junction region [Mus musculus]
EDTGIYYCTLF